jgi:uncharacterized protein YjbI with pentapeptide repeats
VSQEAESKAAIDWDQIDPASTFKDKKFSRMDFSGRMLVGVDFSGSILVECDFSNCDLSHANFEGADLYRSKLRRSVLYASRFRECNLTRCDFSEAYIYGIRIVDFSNITYTRFTNFQLESRRRASNIASSCGGATEYRIGCLVTDTSSLSEKNYLANGELFSFSDFDRAERHMQRSQVYNRLKRLYQANGFNEEARSCLYWERYHRTRSWYRYHTFTGELAVDGDFRNMFHRITQTVSAFIYEQIAGYGLKPKVVLRNMFLVYLAYVAITIFVLYKGSDSGILYTVLEITRQDVGIKSEPKLIDLQQSDMLKIIYFCIFSMFSLTFQYFSPYGHMVWISSFFALVGLSLLALLISALFSVLRND